MLTTGRQNTRLAAIRRVAQKNIIDKRYRVTLSFVVQSKQEFFDQ